MLGLIVTTVTISMRDNIFKLKVLGCSSSQQTLGNLEENY